MSSRSKMVQITRSLIVLDPQSMPANLGYTAREDAPEQAFPALPYDGVNVLPTALGYQSYFGENTRLAVGSLDQYHVQHQFQYQSVNMRTLSVALMEEGVAIANASEGPEGFQWQLVLDFRASAVEGVRRLWTYCVIGNKLYMYVQGLEKFYAIVNAAEYQETTVPAKIENVQITQEWYHEVTQTGILGYKPNFINMEGQIGIFKAANRLGFWDSENAVSWSSGTQIYDFVPSTTTFAGVTTFTDVVGRIVSIKQHGSGFVIYATRSITLVSPLTGSPEKWQGRAIFSDVGVVFDTQVAVAQPDTIHYAITSAGLCRISSGQPEILEVEVMDYVRNNNKIYSLSFVDSRYIMIHVTNDFDSATPEIGIIKLPDTAGNQYSFPPVVPLTGDLTLDLQAMLNAMLASQQAEFSEAQDPIEGVPAPADNEALLPCWDVQVLDTNFSEDAIPRNPRGAEFERVERIPSKSLVLYSEYELDTQLSPPWSGYYYLGKNELDAYFYDLRRALLDMGPEEFVDKYLEETGKIIQLQGVSELAHNTLLEVDTIGQNGSQGNQLFWNRYKSIIVPTDKVLGSTTYPNDEILIEELMHNQITTFETRMTDCGIDIFTHLATRRAQLTMTSQTETIVPAFSRMALGFFFVDGELNREFYGYTMSSDRYFFGLTSEDADLFSKAAWQSSSKPGLNWNTRSGLPLRYDTNYGTILDPWFLALGVDSEVNSTPPTIYGFRHENPSSSADSASWVPVEFPGLYPANIFATLLGVTPAVRTENSSVTYPYDPSQLSPECGPYEEVFGPNGYSVAGSPPVGALQATAIRVTNTVGGNNQNTSEEPVCTRINMASRTDKAMVGTFGLIVVTLNFSGRSPEQVYNAFLADPRINPDDWTEANLLRVRNKIESMMTTELPKLAQLGGFTTSTTRDVINVSEEETSLLRCEVSGYGYYPYGGFSFRKTHSRSLFKPCSYAGSPVLSEGIPPLSSDNIDKQLPAAPNLDPLRPPYQWQYPNLPELPPNYVVFQEGTFAPYYPTYKEAVVLDTHYTKWGRYNNPHKLVYSLFPVNRVDQTIVPNQAGILRGGALRPDGESSIFSTENNNSRITYGKIGDYRLGWTTATKAVAQFGYAANAYIVVETSMDGDTVDTSLTQAATVTDLRRIEMPFTLQGKWFNIRFEGQFNLVGLSLESEGRSRR